MRKIDSIDGPYADHSKNAIWSNDINLANFAHEINHIVNKVHYRENNVLRSSLDESHGKDVVSLYLTRMVLDENYTHHDFEKINLKDAGDNGFSYVISGEVEFDFRKIDDIRSFEANNRRYMVDFLEGVFL